MHAHVKAVLAQLSPDERKFYEQEPQRSWVQQMREQLLKLTPVEGAKMLRENMASFKRTTRQQAPAAGGDEGAKPSPSSSGGSTPTPDAPSRG